MKLTVVLEPSEEGGYTIYVPSLPGCLSEGDIEEEALHNIREAVELYLEPVEDDWVAGEALHALSHPKAGSYELGSHSGTPMKEKNN